MLRRDAIKKSAIIAAVAMGASASIVNANEVKNVKAGMNRIKMKIQDPEKPTEHELKHSPEIKLGEIDTKGFTTVEISIGQKGIIHPSVDNHWIDYIELWADGKLVGKTELEASISRGFDSYKVNLKGVTKLTAIAGCNLHGIWEDSISI